MKVGRRFVGVSAEADSRCRRRPSECGSATAAFPARSPTPRTQSGTRSTALQGILSHAILGLTVLILVGCAAREEVARFTIDGEPAMSWVVPEGVSISFDPDLSKTGNGSIRVDYTGDAIVSVPLFETTEVRVDDCVLDYSLVMASEGLKKPAYAEMTCRVDGNWYFSRALTHALIETMPWKKVRTPFLLQAGQVPDKIRLGIRFEGPGTVWVDGVQLYKR